MNLRLIEKCIPALAVLCLGSCSIKENRMDCPCRLTMDLTEFGLEGPVGLTLWNNGLYVLEKRVSALDSLEMDVPRVVYRFAALPSTFDQWLEGKTNLVVAKGEQFPMVYSYCNQHLDAVCETLCEKVVAHKQYAEIFIDPEDADMSYLQYYLKGETIGFNIMDLSPVAGEFECRMDGAGKLVSAKIPRQEGNGLKIVVSGAERSGTLDLSAFLEDNGYDWNADDLEDVYIKISALKSYVEIDIEDWDRTIVGGGAI